MDNNHFLPHSCIFKQLFEFPVLTHELNGESLPGSRRKNIYSEIYSLSSSKSLSRRSYDKRGCSLIWKCDFQYPKGCRFLEERISQNLLQRNTIIISVSQQEVSC